MDLPRLPPELMCAVFDILAAQKEGKTLQSCALLSRLHLPQIRRLLFSHLKIHLSCHPKPILIQDVARRLQGLCELLRTDSRVNLYINHVEVLDSYPVYDSQWITHQPSLAHFLSILNNLRSFTFGCEVGYLDWSLFSAELRFALSKLFRTPHLDSLNLCNLGSIPAPHLRTEVRYLFLNNVSLCGEHDTPLEEFGDPVVHTHKAPATYNQRLWYLNVRTISAENTATVHKIFTMYADSLKVIHWRCWEDAYPGEGASLATRIDLSTPSALKKLSFRLSYGRHGRDLLGLCTLLESTPTPITLRTLEISLLFPHHSSIHRTHEVKDNTVWLKLSAALRRGEYAALRQVVFDFTIHESVRAVEGRRVSAVVEFRQQMRIALVGLLNTPSFTFKLRVHPFHPDVTRRR